MKKVLIGIMALTCTMAFAEKIGYVNSQELVARYSKTKQIESNLRREKERLSEQAKQKSVAIQKLELELKAKGAKITEAEKKMYENKLKEYQKFISDSEAKLGKEEYKRMEEIENSMKTAIGTVAKKEKMDYILEAAAVKFGGIDLTSQVLKEMERNVSKNK